MEIDSVVLDATPHTLEEIDNGGLVALKTKAPFGQNNIFVVSGAIDDRVALISLDASRKRYLNEDATVYRVNKIVVK